MDEKKSKKGLIIFLLIIIAICLFAAGYYLNNSNNSKNKPNTNETKNEESTQEQEEETYIEDLFEDGETLKLVTTTKIDIFFPGEESYKVYIENDEVKLKGGYTEEEDKIISTGVKNIKTLTTFNHIIAGCCGLDWAALSNAGELYIGHGTSLEKVNYSKKIKDMYVTNEVVEGEQYPLYVLNENDELLYVNLEFDSTSGKYNTTIKNKYEERTIYVGDYPQIFVVVNMKTHEVSNVKINNQNLKAKYIFYYNYYDSDENVMKTDMFIVNDKNEIFEYKNGADSSTLVVKELTFSKYKNEKVKSITTEKVEDKENVIITYESGKTETIKNISECYKVK